MAKIRSALEDFHPDVRLLDERGATVARMRKAEGFLDHSDTGKTTMRDSPIERALARKCITPGQYNAAVKFYNHWYRAGLAGSLGSADLNRVFGGDNIFSGIPSTEGGIFHRERYRQAIDLLSEREAWVLERVVCREIHLEQVGREMKWDNRPQATAAALQVTRDGLTRLAKEWGMDT